MNLAETGSAEGARQRTGEFCRVDRLEDLHTARQLANVRPQPAIYLEFFSEHFGRHGGRAGRCDVRGPAAPANFPFCAYTGRLALSRHDQPPSQRRPRRPASLSRRGAPPVLTMLAELARASQAALRRTVCNTRSNIGAPSALTSFVRSYSSTLPRSAEPPWAFSVGPTTPVRDRSWDVINTAYDTKGQSTPTPEKQWENRENYVAKLPGPHNTYTGSHISPL